jgi:hypothetical protein
LSTLCLGLLVTTLAPRAGAYSVLTHEAIIDSMWDRSLKKLLLQRFPDATPEQLVEAHGYAYGGSIIQDMGYYPFGSKLFTDLLHYVRSGDFVLTLIRDSQDLNEYAFALGALAHYAADNDGHRLATNLSVPMLYPKLRERFGRVVTYADDALSHMKTETAFDVVQVAQGHYAPESYHAFIGFHVARPLLERTFHDTYGLKLEDVFGNLGLAIGTYRYTVSKVMPGLTRVAWEMKEKEIVRDSPGMVRNRFLYNLSRASYHKEWGTEYQRPGFGARFFAFILRALPLGRTKALQFVTPTPAVEKLFMESFNATLERYRRLLAEVEANRLKLPNDNFDVGEQTGPGKYWLCDRAYAQLLAKFKNHYAAAPPQLRRDILAFYGDLSAPISTKSDSGEWAKVVKELDELKAVDAGNSGVPNNE